MLSVPQRSCIGLQRIIQTRVLCEVQGANFSWTLLFTISYSALAGLKFFTFRGMTARLSAF